MSSKNLAQKIKQARIEADLSQKELSKSLIVSEKAVSSYESGRTHPTLDTLEKIAKKTERPMWFFTDEDTDDLLIATKLTKVEKELEEIKKLLKSRTKKSKQP